MIVTIFILSYLLLLSKRRNYFLYFIDFIFNIKKTVKLIIIYFTLLLYVNTSILNSIL